jgi:hypothetical protein
MKGTALLAWMCVAGIAGFALFNVSFKVERLEGELNRLNKAVLKEQKAVHVLRAEWSYLNRPDRIEALARKLLPEMGVADAAQIGGWDRLDASPPAATAIGANGTLRSVLVRSTP